MILQSPHTKKILNNLATNPLSVRPAYTDCPNCGYQKALSTSVKNGRKLFYCHAGCAPGSLRRVMQGDKPPAYQPEHKTNPVHANESAKGFARGLWDNSIPAKGTLVEIYLRSRGLTLPIPDSICFLSKLQHKPSDTRWPVMIAKVTDVAGEFQAIHRTYLAHDGNGKAPVMPQKMTLGAVGGFAIHLSPAGETLAVSEGIETGLSVQQATGIPTWAAISAGGMKQLILPPLPLASTVIICADADPVGVKSAQDAAHRWQREGRIVRIATPPDGLDFNDVLKGATL